MKMFKLISLTICAAILISCDREAITEEGVEANQTSKTLLLENLVLGDQSLPTAGLRSSTDLEQSMQWASFITAKVLRHHSSTRTAVAGLLNGGNETIDLATLLDPSPLDPGLQAFEIAFIDYLEHYVVCCPDPDDEPVKPPFPPGPPPPGEGDPTPEEIAVAYLDYMLDDNCIELYFPNGVNFTGSFDITSSAHPLNNNSSNDGIIRYYSYGSGGFEVGGSLPPFATEDVTIDNHYVTLNDNVIIARPVPGFQVECDYSQYEVGDFTLFPN